MLCSQTCSLCIIVCFRGGNDKAISIPDHTLACSFKQQYTVHCCYGAWREFFKKGKQHALSYILKTCWFKKHHSNH
uniref:Uncharacterized protein n=1 Tax=Anguilla anguilla TaxID=7936 RepID=A0A0E9PY64_ANGAN